MTGKSVRIGLVGYGYWGPNLVRAFAATEGCTVAAICENDSERLGIASRSYPDAKITANYADLLNAASINAIVIATPARLHFDFAIAALQRGKHVLVEKPVTRSLDEFSRLTDEATRRNLALLVDNTFLFTPAVRKLRDIVAGGILGDFSHFDSIRANLGRFRDDVNVFWDLAVHDLVILQYILPDKPVALSAIGVRDVAGHPESIGYLTLFFGSGMIAHINASWLSPRKIRQIVVGGSLRMACYDDVEPDEKLTLYDKCVVSRETPDPLHHLGLGSRRGKKWVLPIEKAEALSRLAEHFRDCIEGTVVPLGDDGLLRRTIELLTAADHSAAQGGRRVSV